MAIFEKKIERKITLDDTEFIYCAIETSQKVNGHTEYVLKLQRGPFKENSWIVLHRYNDFVNLHKCLEISGIELPLPGKKLIGNMQPEFIAQRRTELQEYINIVLMNCILASSFAAKRFVDPETYNTPFHDLALPNASMCLRTEGQWTLGQSLGPIGWRLRKHYFKVCPKVSSKNSPGQSTSKHNFIKSHSHSKSGSNGSSENHAIPPLPDYILSWSEYGPDKYIDDKEIHNVFKNLAGIQHPYIQPIEYVATNDNGGLVIRKLSKTGSLKDVLCGSTPLNSFLSKYGNPKGRAALPLKDVALYGRQILEALRFLHSKGMPYGHLNTGNVFITDGSAHLLDIENFLLGVPSFYRPFFVQHTKINTLENIDVYSFGHLLYEMAMGYPLQESVTRHLTDCPESLKSFLESILSRDALKLGLPSLEQLVEHSFFTEYASNFNETYNAASNLCKPHLKLSTVAKEQIKIAVQKTEQRLRDEQKSVRNQKRLVRVQELMSSEEEKKKIKQKAKFEHKQAKLRQQSSLQLNHAPVPLVPFIRSDSVCSVTPSQETPPPLLQNSATTSSPLPPLPPPAPCDLPKLTEITETGSTPDLPRSALLDSICSFKRASLKKTASHE